MTSIGAKRLVLVGTSAAEWHAERLQERFSELDFVVASTLEDAASRFPDVEVAIVGSALTEAAVARMPRLRWVQSYISGTDEIVKVLAGRPDVLVTSARGLHGPQMAEMAVLHMLALARKVRQIARNQDAHDWAKIPPTVLHGRTVGIVGVGTIGEAIAGLCRAFGMTVYGFSRTTRAVGSIDRMFRRSQLVEVASELDYLVLCVPYAAETDRLVGVEVLQALKPTAFLINLARGRVVDEAALVEALRSGELAGAGLDVFEQEPLPPDSPLWDLDGVFITPHLAGQSDRYPAQLLPLLEENLDRYTGGQYDRLVNLVQRSETT